MSLDQSLQDAVRTVPECVAAGYIDLNTGMLLGVKTVDSHPTEVLDVIAAATADMFQGTNVSIIESMFKRSRGLPEDSHHYFQEMILNSDNLIHVFMRSKLNEDQVLGLVCRKSANLGMVLTKARSVLPGVEKAAA